MKEVELYRNNELIDLTNIEYFPSIQDVDLSLDKVTAFPLSNLKTLGVAFEPLSQIIQQATTGEGGSGIYFVNTFGKQMFHKKGSADFVGSLKNISTGAVGGGAASLTQLPCNPTMMFMSVALMSIEEKLDRIIQIQEDLLAFLEEKESAKLKGNLNTLTDVLNNYKFNWNNEKYKTNKHILVQDIRKDAEQSILLYRELIAKKVKKQSFIHTEQQIKDTVKKLKSYYKDYQLSLYLYSFSSFVEVMLLENFDSSYLESVVNRISEYSYQYRTLYTDAYTIIEKYSQSTIEAGLFNGLSAATKLMGKAVSKVPVISATNIDENLIESGQKIKQFAQNNSNKTLEDIVSYQNSTVLPFIENIKIINRLYNDNVQYFFDKEKLYIK